MADFVRDPEKFLAASEVVSGAERLCGRGLPRAGLSVAIARDKRFVRLTANCVIPLAALTSLPPSINQSVKIRLIRQIRKRTAPRKTNGVRLRQLLTPHPSLLTRQPSISPKNFFPQRVLQLIFLFGIIGIDVSRGKGFEFFLPCR